MTEEIIEKIKSRGYWKVFIRPLDFQKERIKSLNDCANIVDKSTIRLRGWPYPYFKSHKIVFGIDWIQCQVYWQNYIEFWRMYQSGQFAHWFACKEDWLRKSNLVSESLKQLEPGSVMSVLNSVFSFTEIYEFAARLAEKGIFDEALSLNVELHGMQNRKLIRFESWRPMFEDHRCAIETLPYQKIISVDEILGGASDLALDHVLWVFERFNWRRITKEILKEDQKEFLHKK